MNRGISLFRQASDHQGNRHGLTSVQSWYPADGLCLRDDPKGGQADGHIA